MAMLEVKDLSVYYGVIQALKGISFEVNEGDVIALIAVPFIISSAFLYGKFLQRILKSSDFPYSFPLPQGCS